MYTLVNRVYNCRKIFYRMTGDEIIVLYVIDYWITSCLVMVTAEVAGSNPGKGKCLYDEY